VGGKKKKTRQVARNKERNQLSSFATVREGRRKREDTRARKEKVGGGMILRFEERGTRVQEGVRLRHLSQ